MTVIREYLRENGIKQTFVCKKTGISEAKMSAILRERQKMTVEEYVEICRALDVPLQFFFDPAA